MIKKKIKSKTGEGYVDICVCVVAFVMILVLAINLFSFISLRIELDRIADNLLEVATYAGCFDEDFRNADGELLDEYFDYEVKIGADKYFSRAYHRVQLGEKMWIEVSKQTYVKGLGVFKIPITVKVKKSGLSQRYWK